MTCRWVLEGQLSKTTFKTSAKGAGYWTALVRVENGEICLYIHDIVIQRIVEAAKLGSHVVASGILEPHSRYSQAEKPYFLSPTHLTVNDPEQ